MTVELDLTRIPADLDPHEAQRRSTQVFDAVEAAHKDILRRAVDEGHDFERSIRQDHGRADANLFTRLAEWLADRASRRRA